MWHSPIPPPEIHPIGAREAVQIETIEQDGRWFTVRRIDASHGVILSLRSMMPQDYLNPAWRPDHILSWAEDSEAHEKLVKMLSSAQGEQP